MQADIVCSSYLVTIMPTFKQLLTW